jgi:hypothetical protein
VVFVREYLSTQVAWWQYVLGGVYVLTILYLPDGLMGMPARLRQGRLQARLRKHVEVVPSASVESRS